MSSRLIPERPLARRSRKPPAYSWAGACLLAFLLFRNTSANAFDAKEAPCDEQWLGLCLLFLVPSDLIPAEVGPEIVWGSTKNVKWIVGWPMQIPIGPWKWTVAHRLVITPEVVFSHADFRMRFGYRYVIGRWALGLGGVVNEGAIAFSPELGVSDKAVNLIARADIFNSNGEPARTSLLLGWSWY